MPAIAIAMIESITTGGGKTTPRSSRARRGCRLGRRAGRRVGRATGSDLEAEAAGGALALARGAQPAQAADQQRVGLEGLGTVDERVQHLVVARRGHVELLADRGLLGAGVLPPLALEVEDLAVALAERRARGVLAGAVEGVHSSCL